MTDNRTSELLREGLTERGIEWHSGLVGVTIVGDWCFVEYGNGNLAATCEPVLTPEQAIAATLGSDAKPCYATGYTHERCKYSVNRGWVENVAHGTLTAEQVREAIEEAKNELLESCEYVGDMYQRQSDVLRAFGKMEQAIADELNARADLESEPPYDELLRCLENDWHIHASWDGLRRFWCIELTEEGVRLRDEWNARAERTCKPQGEWERTSQTQEIRHIYCECGEYLGEDRRESFPFAIEAKADLPNYCPNCGAKVIGGDDSFARGDT